MHWIVPSEKDTASATLEKRLWGAADQFRANSGLKAQEYSGPILGLIFLRFAEVRFAAQRTKLEAAGASSRRGSRVDEPAAYHAEGILYLNPEACFDTLLALPEANVRPCSSLCTKAIWSGMRGFMRGSRKEMVVFDRRNPHCRHAASSAR